MQHVQAPGARYVQEMFTEEEPDGDTPEEPITIF
jgi:hypothetical protein